ncbi:mitochondrial ubiquitin ligase activator of nfkb 1-A [Salarias fasciatus]|uniref:RING-type E3 ubiquitin transferase n=1 Tax=Salarias fasciatus TaxID=181472 RepID=A0A672HY02_SALFA|nr:mitochondrial ubiquitin ligase activator of nfkb 1-A-like [Salarias fasciatus]
MSDLPVNLVLIGVGSSFALSGLFYHLYQEKQKELQKLKEIPLFRPDQNLLRVLQATPYRRLQYVAVEGMVQADGEPLASQFVPRRSAVIQKIAVEEDWKYWNSITGTWNSRTINRKETNNAVPFSLVSPSAYIPDVYVKVHGPLEAGGSFLERVHFKVRRAEEGLVDVVVQGLNGEKPVAKRESEELLCVGSTVTGFGEVVLEGGQVARLQAPQDGRQFVLVPTCHRSFIQRHEDSASMWKKLTALASITGTCLLAGFVHNLSKRKDR